MILFLRHGVISQQQYELMFTPMPTFTPNSGYALNEDKIEEDILGDMAKYNVVIKHLIEQFNLEL
jgi:hypothetical protein